MTSAANARRWAILGQPPQQGDCIRIEGLDVQTLDNLIEEGFLDPLDMQNDSPSVGEFRDFMATHPGVRAHGYVISPSRSDTRISLEGLEFRGTVTAHLLRDFTHEFGRADEFTAKSRHLFCWYD